jgi:hypothetical protein
MRTKISQIIEEASRSENVLAALAGIDVQHIAKTVDFSPDADRSSPQVKYTIDVSSTFPKHRDGLLCFFATHHDEKLQVLKSDSYGKFFFGSTLVDMNKELNNRLRDCSQNAHSAKMVRLAVGYGEHVYQCKNIEGTVYVLWANVNRKNVGNVRNTISECALLMNLDGWGNVKGIFMLKQKVLHESDLLLIPLVRGNPEFMWPKEDIFVCEKRPKQIVPKHLHLVSRQLARQLIQSPSKDAMTWLPYEQNKFHGAGGLDDPVDSEDAAVMGDALSEAELTEEGLSWTDTPRDILYEDVTPRTQDGMAMSLVSESNSNGSKKPLPFIPRINYMRPTAALLSKATKIYKERDPFEADDPETAQRTRDYEEEIRVESAVMGNAQEII